jgi:hypothetical protein
MPNKLSKTDKILKLANAIREYRGIFDLRTQSWKKPPNKGAMKRIRRWLDSLGIATVENTKAIDGFKTFDEMNAWLKEVAV